MFWKVRTYRSVSVHVAVKGEKPVVRGPERQEVGPFFFFTRGSSSMNAHADFLRLRKREHGVVRGMDEVELVSERESSD